MCVVVCVFMYVCVFIDTRGEKVDQLFSFTCLTFSFVNDSFVISIIFCYYYHILLLLYFPQVSPHLLIDPNEISRHLPVREEVFEKLEFPGAAMPAASTELEAVR